MDAIELLESDHIKLRQQMVMIHHCLACADLRDKVNAFVASYELHEVLEEEILPLLVERMLEASPDLRALVTDYALDHREIWVLLNRLLESLGFSELPQIRQAFFDVCACVEHHMDREERLLFPMLQKFVDPSTLAEVASRAQSRLSESIFTLRNLEMV